MIEWRRSWPRVVPEGRAYVVDSIPRVLIDDYSYGLMLHGLCQLRREVAGVVMMEWDIAIGKEDRDALQAACEADETAFHVVPYMLYESDEKMPRWLPDGPGAMFGLGCTYLPLPAIRQLMQPWTPPYPVRFGDGHVSAFAYLQSKVIVHPEIHVVHLHY